MNEKLKKFKLFPRCLLCRGNGYVEFMRSFRTFCPACNYEDWDECNTIELYFDADTADEIRNGIFIKNHLPYLAWKKHIPCLTWKKNEGGYNQNKHKPGIEIKNKKNDKSKESVT